MDGGMDAAKIDAAVSDALAVCGTGEDRFVRLVEYINTLSNDPLWASQELTVFHDRIHRLISQPDGDCSPTT